MFTGIITDIGTIQTVDGDQDRHARIACHYDLGQTDLGASIACDGVCLTVVSKQSDSFTVDISTETLEKTNLSGWQVGKRINLEKALRVGDELGGHIVTGHVDGRAKVVSVSQIGESLRVEFAAPTALARFIAPKGSVALNGTSLTVNEVDGDNFTVNLIPHTQTHTTWNAVKAGDLVNLEIDTLARYVARLAETA